MRRYFILFGSLPMLSWLFLPFLCCWPFLFLFYFRFSPSTYLYTLFTSFSLSSEIKRIVPSRHFMFNPYSFILLLIFLNNLLLIIL
jgi:hypothetical protein